MTKKLSVKELADALNQSPWYVYKMRASGFVMSWDEESGCLVATSTSARRWIKKTGFRVIDGYGECKRSAKRVR